MTTTHSNLEIGRNALRLVRPAFLLIALALLVMAGLQKGYTNLVERDGARSDYPQVGSAIPTLPAIQVSAPNRG